MLLKEEAKGLSTRSSGSNSSGSFDLNDDDDGEGATDIVAQILTVEPVLMLSSDSEATDDLAFPNVAPTAEDLIEHSFNLGECLKKYFIDLKKSNQRSHTFECELKKSRLDQARNEAEAALEQLNKALQENAELKKVASREVFQKLGTSSNHSAWNAAPLYSNPQDHPQFTRHFFLPGFNEEEYMNQSTNEEVVIAIEVGTIRGNDLSGGRKDANFDVPHGNKLRRGEVERVVGAKGVSADEENPPEE
ncbi:hypothetical protein Acr_00g0049340 [Actinidia rufa]|uniref:Uncharacterized protein n=1 Tax=Actinidia rufa TaxID=165716 RepID=A0A7J0DK86_9ERIC|nr:hypothetical protein Acr_00g0049340 [Actinidia rufa]